MNAHLNIFFLLYQSEKKNNLVRIYFFAKVGKNVKIPPTFSLQISLPVK